jgi:hypothetical protein
MTETIQQLKEDIAILQQKLKKLEHIEKTRTNVEKAYRDAYGHFLETSGFAATDWDAISWEAFQKGYEAAEKSKVKPSMINCVLEGNPPNGYSCWKDWFEECGSKGILHNLKISSKNFKKETKSKVEEETFPDEWYNDVKWNEDNTPVITDEVVNKMLKKWEENPPEFLKFELGKTLEDLITRWWCDVFTTHDDWDMETAIDDLVDQIQLWLPREGSSEGSQDHYAIVATDAENALLQKIKSKLRNKK